jgi:uncharacterized protein YjbI with pentapeptide repeats
VRSINLLVSMCVLLLTLPTIAGNERVVPEEDQKFLIAISKKYFCWIGTSDLSQKDNFAASLNNCEKEITKEWAYSNVGRLVHEANLKYFKALQRRFPIPEPNSGDLKRLLAEKKCPGCDLRGADLPSYLRDILVGGADLSSANLSSANLTGYFLGGSNLSNANLRSAYLTFANMNDADLTGADLRNAVLLATTLKKANLQRANLEGSLLLQANFENADLRRANLRNANLEGANLEGANLEGANLEGANLEGATLKKANLLGTNLSGTRVNKGRGINPDILRGPIGICYAILSEDIKKEMDCANSNLTGPLPRWFLRLRAK